jgi:hypothetical protein
LSRPPQDPEIARALGKRAQIFALVAELRRGSGPVTAVEIEAAMRRMPEGTFAPADYAWVRNMLGKRQ